MEQVDISEFKARLSDYLATVQDGEELLVADRGRPIARLVPAGVLGGDEEDERLLDLQRRGIVRVGTGVLPPEFWDTERPADPDASVRKALEAERSEGW